MDKLRDLKIWCNGKWAYHGGLVERDTSLEFRTVPINSFIPCLVFSLMFITIGVFILKREVTHWYVTVVCWVFAGVLLKKTKYVTYAFDKIEGNFLVVNYNISGRSAQDFWLDEIEQLVIQETHDLQAWTSDVQLYIYLTEGRRIKLFAGQLFGIRKELKYFIHEKLIGFLNLSEDGNHKRFHRRRTSTHRSGFDNSFGSSPSDDLTRRDSSGVIRKDSLSRRESSSDGGIIMTAFDESL